MPESTHIYAGRPVIVRLGDRDAVNRCVQLAFPGTRQSVSDVVSGPRRQGCGAAVASKGVFAVQARHVGGLAEDLRCSGYLATADPEQARGTHTDARRDLTVEFRDGRVELTDASRELAPDDHDDVPVTTVKEGLRSAEVLCADRPPVSPSFRPSMPVAPTMARIASKIRFGRADLRRRVRQ